MSCGQHARRCARAVAVMVLGACGRTEAPAAAVAPPVAAAVQLLPVDVDSLPALPVPGGVVEAARWQDDDGEHLVLLVETGAIAAATSGCANCRDAAVYAFHLVRAADDWREEWRVADRLRDCDLDLYAGFVEGSLVITDLDADGVLETTFQYTLACRSGVTPAVRKLVMREGAAVYEIRGTTDLRSRRAPTEPGGMMRVHPAFETAHPAQRSFALREWHRLITHDDLRRF